MHDIEPTTAKLPPNCIKCQFLHNIYVMGYCGSQSMCTMISPGYIFYSGKSFSGFMSHCALFIGFHLRQYILPLMLKRSLCKHVEVADCVFFSKCPNLFKSAAVVACEVQRLSIQISLWYERPRFPKQIHWDAFRLEAGNTDFEIQISGLQR